MTPEFNFVLAAVRRFLWPELPFPCVEGLDWNEVIRIADSHAVTAFVFDVCQRPELRERVLEAACSGLTLSAELMALLEMFEKQMIDVVSLKGPVLSVALYQGKVLRTCSDLDLLVRPGDALRAKRALEAIGYRLTSVPHWPADTAYLRNPNCQLSFTDPADQLNVDLHWRLLPHYFPPSFEDAQIWSKLRTVPWGRSQARTLAPEHLLLFLCGHGTKHRWQRLGWVCDIARLIQVEPYLDWKEVFAQAGRTDTSRMVSLGLLLASDLLGAALPPAAVKLMAVDAHTSRLSGTVINQLRADVPASAVDTAMFYIRVSNRLSHQARLVFGIFAEPTEAEYRALQLPPGIYWLYYLFRPLRLAVKYGRRLVGL
jgi:Uncharacterised nucleotidyltransferase